MDRPVLLPPALTWTALVGLVLAAAACPAGTARAQNTVIQAENVRFDYAQVLRVTPVYQTLKANTVEEKCEDVPTRACRARSARSRTALTRDVLGNTVGKAAAGRQLPPGHGERDVASRTIAYDVDYTSQGRQRPARGCPVPLSRDAYRAAAIRVARARRWHGAGEQPLSFGLRRRGCMRGLCDSMNHLYADADVPTSAYMAAGMTSRRADRSPAIQLGNGHSRPRRNRRSDTRKAQPSAGLLLSVRASRCTSLHTRSPDFTR